MTITIASPSDDGINPAYLDALRADLARLRETARRLDAYTARHRAQRRCVLREIDAVDDRLAAVGAAR